MKRLLILLMLVSQPVWAEWVELGSTRGGTVSVYWDPSTVRKTVNGRRAWAMISFEQPQAQSYGTYQSSKSVDEFDCEGERYRNLQSSAFSGPMGTGNVVISSNSPSQWEFVIPRSVAENQLKAVCRMPLK